MDRISKQLKRAEYRLIGSLMREYNSVFYKRNNHIENIAVFNTALQTDNLGDEIIMHYCSEILKECFGNKKYYDISTHIVPTDIEEEIIRAANYKFVCGTNLLTSHIEQWWNWRLPDGYINKLKYKGVILLGAGWGKYEDDCSEYTTMIYKSIFDPRIIHSVRDEYTERKLKKAGIKNVKNTGCPTMWRLTPSFCDKISPGKADDVVTTITDYRQDAEQDSCMLKILEKNYRTVFVWLQGRKDEEYLNNIYHPSNMVVIPHNLKDYDELLNTKMLDYVGTRLHAGIFALNHQIRSLIITVDNRATEIAKDTNLPVISRTDIDSKLDMHINSDRSTNIVIDQEAINCFKKQFISL